jgi:hypothetical protein
MKNSYEAEKRFQKCLAQWAGASTPAEAAAAEGRVRALMEKHDIDPWDVSDTSYYNRANFGSNTLFQQLREEYRAAHPLKPEELDWKPDPSSALGDAMGYRAGEYCLWPKIMKGRGREGDRIVYSVREGEKVLISGSYFRDCKAKAETHNKPQNRKARAKALAKAIAESEALMAYYRDNPLDLGDFGKSVDELEAEEPVPEEPKP